MSGVKAPLVVWFLAFSFSGVFNLLYASFLLSTNSTWTRFAQTSRKELPGKFLNVSEASRVDGVIVGEARLGCA